MTFNKMDLGQLPNRVACNSESVQCFFCSESLSDDSPNVCFGGSAPEHLALFQHAVRVIVGGERRVRSDRRLFLGTLIGLLFVFFYTVDLELTYPRFAYVVRPKRFSEVSKDVC